MYFFSISIREQPYLPGEGQHVPGAHGHGDGWGSEEVAVHPLWQDGQAEGGYS